MATFKIIKTSNWTTNSGTKGQTLVVAYKGRVYTANPADFESAKIEKDLFTPGEKCEAIKSSYTDVDGTAKQGFKLVPVSDISIVDG
jgi:spore germination protein YaaH